jgi:SPP1 gp7 family putative phage head morphogenesis protein
MTDDFIKHHILLDRLARGFAKDYEAAFKSIARYIDREIRVNPDFVDLAMLRVEIQRRLDAVTASTINKLEQFAVYEGRFNKRVIEKDTDKKIELPTAETLAAITGVAIATSFTKSSSQLGTTFNAFAQKKTDDYMRVVDDAIIQEDTRAARDAKVSDISDGMFSTQAKALLGLGVLAVASNTLKVVQEENNIRQVQWLAILDDHVCPYCQSLNGRVFNIEDLPAHPAHGNCRCSVVPYV